VVHAVGNDMLTQSVTTSSLCVVLLKTNLCLIRGQDKGREEKLDSSPPQSFIMPMDIRSFFTQKSKDGAAEGKKSGNASGSTTTAPSKKSTGTNVRSNNNSSSTAKTASPSSPSLASSRSSKKVAPIPKQNVELGTKPKKPSAVINLPNDDNDDEDTDVDAPPPSAKKSAPSFTVSSGDKRKRNSTPTKSHNFDDDDGDDDDDEVVDMSAEDFFAMAVSKKSKSKSDPSPTAAKSKDVWDDDDDEDIVRSSSTKATKSKESNSRYFSDSKKGAATKSSSKKRTRDDEDDIDDDDNTDVEEKVKKGKLKKNSKRIEEDSEDDADDDDDFVLPMDEVDDDDDEEDDEDFSEEEEEKPKPRRNTSRKSSVKTSIAKKLATKAQSPASSPASKQKKATPRKSSPTPRSKNTPEPKKKMALPPLEPTLELDSFDVESCVVPECLEGLAFVFTGVLNDLARDSATDLVKCLGGRVTTAVSGKTDYLVVGEVLEDGRMYTEGSKYKKATEGKLSVQVVMGEKKLYGLCQLYQEQAQRERGMNPNIITAHAKTEPTSATKPASPAPVPAIGGIVPSVVNPYTAKTGSTGLENPNARKAATATVNPYAKTTASVNPYAKPLVNPYAKPAGTVSGNPYAKSSGAAPANPYSKTAPAAAKSRVASNLDEDNSSLWVDKHAPKSTRDILGNKDNVQKLTTCKAPLGHLVLHQS
jgi:replication factor C subunit 1